jgi:THO complex subunit 1
MDFQARYVLITTSTPELLKQRLEASGKEESAIQEISNKLPTELEPGKIDEVFDTSIVNDDDVEAVKAIGNYIYGESEGEQGLSEDTAMKDEEEDTNKVAETKEATMTDV